MHPLISVIMPVYEGEQYLDAALASIRAQSLADFELIAVDDGSTDRTGQILARHGREDPRVKPVRQDHLGLVAALNRALSSSAGAFVASMHADDVARPERLEVQLAWLRARPSVALIGSAYDLLARDGRVVKTMHPPTDPQAIREMLPERNCFAHPTVMFRRDAVLAIGGYRAAYPHSEDYDLWLRLSETAELANLSQVLLSYRLHSRSVSATHCEQLVMSELGAIEAARRRRRGEADPTPAEAVAARPWLRSLGIEDREIDRRVRRHALRWARLMRRAGERDAARRLVSVARSFIGPADGPRDRLDFRLRTLKAWI